MSTIIIFSATYLVFAWAVGLKEYIQFMSKLRTKYLPAMGIFCKAPHYCKKQKKKRFVWWKEEIMDLHLRGID